MLVFGYKHVTPYRGETRRHCSSPRSQRATLLSIGVL